MVHHHVHDHADVMGLGRCQQMVEIRHRAEHGIDRFIIGNVIAEILLRGGVNRRQPNGIDLQTLQIVETLNDSVDVTDSIAVCVLETARIDFIHQGMFPPR